MFPDSSLHLNDRALLSRRNPTKVKELGVAVAALSSLALAAPAMAAPPYDVIVGSSNTDAIYPFTGTDGGATSFFHTVDLRPLGAGTIDITDGADRGPESDR